MLGTLLNGWETFGIVTLQTGRPFTVALLSEIDNSGTGRSILGFGANDRPNLVGNPELSNPTTLQWFNTAAFAFPTPGTFGNAGRNILEGPGFQNVNASLLKNTRLTRALQFAVPCRSLQPLQSSKLQPTGQLPRLPNVRTDHVSTRPATYSVWIEVVVLSHRFTQINADSIRGIRVHLCLIVVVQILSREQNVRFVRCRDLRDDGAVDLFVEWWWDLCELGHWSID